MAHVLFDTHCHLLSENIWSQKEKIIHNAKAAGVKGMAIISADWPSVEAVHEFFQKPDELLKDFTLAYSIGIHPHDASTLIQNAELSQSEADSRKLRLHKYFEGANAVGETGLDYYYNHSDPKIQLEAFEWQISEARLLKKPLILHCRDAAKDLIAVLQNQKVKEHHNPGIFHCFSENLEIARQALDLGFYISLSGIITFKNATQMREIAKTLPLDRVLIETDAPWLAPVPKRGTLNEPSFVEFVAKKFAEERSESVDEIYEALWRNSCKVFCLPLQKTS